MAEIFVQDCKKAGKNPKKIKEQEEICRVHTRRKVSYLLKVTSIGYHGNIVDIWEKFVQVWVSFD